MSKLLEGVCMPNRTLCQVLEEMRKSNKTRNYSYLLGLIEEAQSLGERMESALWDQKDLKNIREHVKKLKEERDDLKAEIKALTKQKGLIS